jgi:bifunctional DNA-binding transcriptional regulator/antitoxin component of YhaV-PrlF toxin-antitoxin module
MRRAVATITSKRQITVPIEIRRHLQVDVHDKLEFIIDADGDVRIRPVQYPTIASLAGAAGTLDQLMAWDDVLAIAHEDRARAKLGRDDAQ